MTRYIAILTLTLTAALSADLSADDLRQSIDDFAASTPMQFSVGDIDNVYKMLRNAGYSATEAESIVWDRTRENAFCALCILALRADMHSDGFEASTSIQFRAEDRLAMYEMLRSAGFSHRASESIVRDRTGENAFFAVCILALREKMDSDGN